MSFDYIEALVRKHRSKGLLVDTNVLLLLLVGSVDAKLIESFKITSSQGFTLADFKVLQTFVGYFQRVVTTPHILAEASNHADKLKGDHHKNVFHKLASLIALIEEHADAAKSLASSEAFLRFGLTDAAIDSLALRGYLVLSVDLPLVGYLGKKGVGAVNFNHLRQLSW